MSIQRIQPSKRFSEVVIHEQYCLFCRPSTEKPLSKMPYEQTKEVLFTDR